MTSLHINTALIESLSLLLALLSDPIGPCFNSLPNQVMVHADMQLYWQMSNTLNNFSRSILAYKIVHMSAIPGNSEHNCELFLVAILDRIVAKAALIFPPG